MKKALVCGAGGFIGSHLVKRLKKEGMNVLPTQIFDLGDDPLYIGIDPTDLPKSQYLVDRNFE